MPLVVDGIVIPFEGEDNVTKVIQGVNASLAKMIEAEKAAAQNQALKVKLQGMTQAEKDLFLATEKARQALELQNQTAAKGSAITAQGVGSWTELSSAIGIAKQAYQVIGMVVDETFGKFQKYAGEVLSLSQITKTGAEETSRFLQVIDDYKLTAVDAETATKALKEKGLVPTIDTLANLSDEYRKIKDPAEAFKFIQDNLGKGGKDTQLHHGPLVSCRRCSR